MGKWDLKYRHTFLIRYGFFIVLLLFSIYCFIENWRVGLIVFLCGYLILGFCFRGFLGTWFAIPYVGTNYDDISWLRSLTTKEEIIEAFKRNPHVFEMNHDVIFWNDDNEFAERKMNDIEYNVLQHSNYHFKDSWTDKGVLCKSKCNEYKSKTLFFYEVDNLKAEKSINKWIENSKCNFN